MLFNIFRVIFIILEVVLLFNLLIIVHELGHFLAARWRGLVVEKFGIWFGKPLWKKEINGVTYSLGSIPAGGFVSLPQMAPMEAIEGKNENDRQALPPISPLDKIIVAFAGPLFSFGLAIVCATVVWLVGRPVGEAEMTRTIGYVEEGGPADVAGLQVGDEILEVDNKPVKRFSGMVNSVMWNVVRSEGETVPFKVNRGGEILTFNPVPEKAPRDGLRRSNLRMVKLGPMASPVVAGVTPGSPAERAGLQVGDVVVTANGQSYLHFAPLTEAITSNPDQAVDLVVDRRGEMLNFSITPEMMPAAEGVPAAPRIGVAWNFAGKMDIAHPNPVEQVSASVATIVNTLGALFSPKSDIKAEHLSGPVGIMTIYYRMFESPDGWRLALWFSVVLNVNLAILNMLPLPVLDGGHITIALIEAVRRKPINIRVLEFVQTACALLLIGYMLYVTFFDVQDFAIFQGDDPPPVQATPTPPPEP